MIQDGLYALLFWVFGFVATAMPRWLRNWGSGSSRKWMAGYIFFIRMGGVITLLCAGILTFKIAVFVITRRY